MNVSSHWIYFKLVEMLRELEILPAFISGVYNFNNMIHTDDMLLMADTKETAGISQ